MENYKYFSPATDPKIVGVDEKTMMMADRAREKSGIPWTITSGKRTPEANAADPNAAKKSAHLTGEALDIGCRDSHRLWSILFGLMNNGARRIGIYVTRCTDDPKKLRVTHVHFDTSPDLPQEVLWIEEEQ